MLTIVYFAMVLMAGNGVRGTDQLWYAREVQTVIDGRIKISNEVYPRPFLENHRVETPFMHHTLCLYCIAAASKWLGVVRGWQFTMGISTIVAGACVAWVVYDFTRGHIAALCTYGVYLLNPLTVWQSGNLLMEPFYGMLMALATLQYVTAEKDKARWMLLFVTLCFAIQCRPIFLPLLFGFPLAFFFHAGRPYRLPNALLAIAFALLGCIAVVVCKLLFDNALAPTLPDIIRNCGPGKGLMEYYFALDTQPVTIDWLWEKFLWAMKRQFLFAGDLKMGLLYGLYNASVVGALILMVVSLRSPHNGRERRLAFLACFVFAIHMAFISLHIAQPRTCLAFLAPQMACAAVVIARMRESAKNTLAFAGAIVMAIFLWADVVAIKKTREDAAAFRVEQEALQRDLEIIPNHDRVIAESNGGMTYLNITYASYPRPSLALSPEHRYSVDVYRRLQRQFEAKWLICPEQSPLPAIWSAEKIPLPTPLHGKMSNLAIYRLKMRDNDSRGGDMGQ